MKKYFLNDGTAPQGPFSLEELKSKNITAETPVRYEDATEWTTAGKLDELKDFFNPPPATPAAAPVVIAAAATPANPAKPVAPAKKSSAALSWVLTLVVLGGAGYFVYQDMEKNKTTSGNMTQSSTGNALPTEPATTQSPDTATSPVIPSTGDEDATTVTETGPVTTPTTATTATAQTDAQKAAAKKAEDDKKKQLALKKAEDEKKKQEAAKAAREMEMRNHWTKYISFGNLNYDTKGDGVKAFDVPVYNGTDAPLDKVTVRVEYTKKNDKKIVNTETITIYNIPARGGLNGKAAGYKKGDKANVYITEVSSRKLHFCYPQNNGNANDPYFCK